MPTNEQIIDAYNEFRELTFDINSPDQALKRLGFENSMGIAMATISVADWSNVPKPEESQAMATYGIALFLIGYLLGCQDAT